jgi:hypothetical protein
MWVVRAHGEWPYDQFACCIKRQWIFEIEGLFETWSLCLQTCIIHKSNEKTTFGNTMIQNNKKDKI